MFDKVAQTNVLIEDCYAEANGQDECIAINPSDQITESGVVNAIIRNCRLVNKFNNGKGSNSAGLISLHPNTEQTLISDGNTIIFNISIENCVLKAVGAATNVARFYASQGTAIYLRCNDTQFNYSGSFPFPDRKNVQSGMVLLHKNTSLPCSFVFRGCVFEGDYILSYQHMNWDSGEVLFSNCMFNCKSFVRSNNKIASRRLQNAKFVDCDFKFLQTPFVFGIGAPVFEKCNFFCPNESLSFSDDSMDSLPVVMKNVRLNGVKLPDRDKLTHDSYYNE